MQNFIDKIRQYKIVILELLGIFVALCVLLLGSAYINDNTPHSVNVATLSDDSITFVPYSEFKAQLKNGEISIVFYDQTIQYLVYAKTDLEEIADLTATEKASHVYDNSDLYRTYYSAEDNWRSLIIDCDTDLYSVSSGNATSNVGSIIKSAFGITFIIAIIWILCQMVAPYIQTKTLAEPTRTDVSFDDIIGLDEIMDQLEGIVSIIKSSKHNKLTGEKDDVDEIGYKLSRGVLLSGPGGVGKTMIAKAIAHEAGVPFYSVSGSDFTQVFVGLGAMRIRELFKEARKHTPCIIFIDEFDSLARSRKGMWGNGGNEYITTLNAFLKEMDGFNTRGNIFVLAATNNKQFLDEAAIRSGRFDRTIVVAPPTKSSVRTKMFDKYLGDKKVDVSVDTKKLGEISTGLTGADIATICNEAAFLAITHKHPAITQDDMQEALDNKSFDGVRAKDDRGTTTTKLLAYHEAGHAVIRYLTGYDIQRVTIQNMSGGPKGFVGYDGIDVTYSVEHDKEIEPNITKEDIINNIHTAYAGKAAEYVALGISTVGPASDIANATAQIRLYVTMFGFDEEFTMLSEPEAKDYNDNITAIDFDVQKHMRELSIQFYKETVKIIKDNLYLVEALAKALIEKVDMSGTEVMTLLKEVEEKHVSNSNNI